MKLKNWAVLLVASLATHYLSAEFFTTGAPGDNEDPLMLHYRYPPEEGRMRRSETVAFIFGYHDELWLARDGQFAIVTKYGNYHYNTTVFEDCGESFEKKQHELSYNILKHPDTMHNDAWQFLGVTKERDRLLGTWETRSFGRRLSITQDLVAG